ncbi:signal peptide peptidase SppA [Oceanobacillus chungangensis]|uniref:Signal peptide peptidase SppA n=1 Tax=Oceanobacillus chungangensis TaxID=1229152 RepID=A0A3D8PXM6_9BACI|nr:signal peptide peptidase SppA [Oceanobacillus chungangensis]RDW20900.1 signal peptide peptidase SppA [Oceanobacillus chungangensis]
MDKKRWIALVIAVGIFIVSIISQIRTTVATTDFDSIFNSFNGKYGEEVIDLGTSMDKIAVLRLNGVIQEGIAPGLLSTGSYNHQRFLDLLDHAGEDKSIKAIVMDVNTPGGGVVESAEIHEKVLEIQQTYKKPVYVSMGNTAASGGYYISAPADKIVAHPATLTGSIGVIMQALNYAELADNLGIDFNTIKSGEYKDIMSASREMTDGERTILQTMIDELYGEFVQVIVDGRGMSESTVRELGDGRVYTGTQAKENGLVDELGTLDDTIAMMKEEQGLSDATVIEYTNGFEFNKFLGGAVQSVFGNQSELADLENIFREANAPRAMYLYSR